MLLTPQRLFAQEALRLSVEQNLKVGIRVHRSGTLRFAKGVGSIIWKKVKNVFYLLNKLSSIIMLNLSNSKEYIIWFSCWDFQLWRGNQNQWLYLEQVSTVFALYLFNLIILCKAIAHDNTRLVYCRVNRSSRHFFWVSSTIWSFASSGAGPARRAEHRAVSGSRIGMWDVHFKRSAKYGRFNISYCFGTAIKTFVIF